MTELRSARSIRWASFPPQPMPIHEKFLEAAKEAASRPTKAVAGRLYVIGKRR